MSSDKISSLVLKSCHVYFAVLLINFISADVILDIFCSPTFRIRNKLGSARALYIFSVVCYWTGGGFQVLLIISIIWRTFDILTVITFYSGVK